MPGRLTRLRKDHAAPAPSMTWYPVHRSSGSAETTVYRHDRALGVPWLTQVTVSGTCRVKLRRSLAASSDWARCTRWRPVHHPDGGLTPSSAADFRRWASRSRLRTRSGKYTAGPVAVSCGPCLSGPPRLLSGYLSFSLIWRPHLLSICRAIRARLRAYTALPRAARAPPRARSCEGNGYRTWCSSARRGPHWSRVLPTPDDNPFHAG